ncbi:hypothetical protein Glove_174g148 [Diversispora epigaea]|uniref:Uncharacterized protein n=1 Tax=Diversispora epigaea TaxID=1348612 RepID=A0A397INL2_9GLOM|nr:hypothetical protein Glove_174g148 [Diversispora epigaea]
MPSRKSLSHQLTSKDYSLTTLVRLIYHPIVLQVSERPEEVKSYICQYYKKDHETITLSYTSCETQLQEETPHRQYYKEGHIITPATKQGKKRGTEDAKSQKSFASAHVERLLPYHSCKVHQPVLVEMVNQVPNKNPNRPPTTHYLTVLHPLKIIIQLTYNPPNYDLPSNPTN